MKREAQKPQFIHRHTAVCSAKLQPLQDRMLLNAPPRGYFSVLMETVHNLVALLRHGLPIDQHTMPDISIGQCWGRHYVSNGLEKQFGPRKKWPHHYPYYFKQRREVEAWVYPREALSAFRIWLEDIYLPVKLPQYLHRKARKGAIDPALITRIVDAVLPVAA